MFRRTLSYFFVSLTIIFSISYSQDNILSVGNADIVAGETTNFEISLSNPNDVIAGFELYLTDFPNTYGTYISVDGTDRTSGFTISANEQPDGTYIIVGFDLSLSLIHISEPTRPY